MSATQTRFIKYMVVYIVGYVATTAVLNYLNLGGTLEILAGAVIFGAIAAALMIALNSSSKQ